MRLDRIVHEVDDDAADLLDVEPHRRQRRRELPLDPDVAEEAVVERERVGQHGVQVRRHGARRRHPRELRELVHQRLERLDLADDRRRALVDERARSPPARRRSAGRMRSADSWIGVSGFLISCASRRATSRQAATRCVRTSGVTSSNTSTVPSCAPPRPAAPSPRRPDGSRALRAPARSPGAAGFADAGADRAAPARRAAADPRGRAPARPATPTMPGSTSSRRPAAELMVLMRAVGPDRDDAGRDPFEHRLDVAAALVELGVLALHLDARALEAALARRQLPRHRVERLDQRAELVARLRLDPVIEVPGADLRARRPRACRPAA